MFVSAISEANNNFAKLFRTKSKQITLMYRENLVFITSWRNLVICLFCKVDANQPLVQLVSKEILATMDKQFDSIEKVSK